MGSRQLVSRPALAAIAATLTSLGCVIALSAAPATAAKPGPPPPPSADSLPTYSTSVVGISPQAAAKTTSSGKTIRSLTLDGGKFYVGHGDYINNSGATKVATFDPTTRTFAESGLTAPTEEITTYRKINGKLYAPWTDPTGSATSNQGFSTNASGTWTNEFKAPAEHVFDVATLTGTDLWMVGSARWGTGGGAAAYRSTDGGKTWALAMKDTSATYGGYERYYWAAALNGKMYMQAKDVYGGAPLRAFDGRSWSTVSLTPCTAVEARAVEVFAGKILCPNYLKGLVAFDGRNATTVLPQALGNVLDFDIPGDGFVYALTPTGIFRSSDAMTWTGLARTPDLSWSIGVHNGTVYIGQRLNATIVKLDGLNVATATRTATTTSSCRGNSKNC